MDVEKTVAQFKTAALKSKGGNVSAHQGSTLKLTETNYRRYSAEVDIQDALQMFNIER